jgi:hypothetical protein
MQFTKENLDTSICEIELGATNKETVREFIRNSEKEFGMQGAELEKMSDEELNNYIEHLSYLWDK